MKLQIFWTIIYAIAFGTLGFNLLIEELKAQTQTRMQHNVSIPLNDQAQYLRNLDTRSADQWSFVTDNQLEKVENYQISISDPKIKLTEQKPPEWRNTGDDPNYSLLVDVYDFTPETNPW